VQVVVMPEGGVPPPLRAQVEALHAQVWPGDDGPGVATGHDPALRPLSMLLLDDDDRVVATLDILSKTITHRGETYAASGLSAVVTDLGFRRAGHGRRLVAEARRQMAGDGADLCLFTCDPPLTPFYEQAGFERLPGTQLIGGTFDDPLPSGPLGKVTLTALFTPHAAAHAADFRHTDIELYPGAIDRLW
jgi:GNAT superfamily N-acetyltransferase